MSAVLETRGVDKRFGAVTAADAVSVAVEAGERLSVIGANGAGKTTFMNLVTGHLHPDSGTIHMGREDITREGPRQIARRGVCRSFQIPQLVEPMTAEENVMVAIGASGRAFARLRPAHDGTNERDARALLDRFGLGAYAERPVSELPGGVRKLLDIAMAMVRSPQVLLLDEPTSGVSADEKFPLMDTVMAALDPDVTVIFVEHDMDIVTRYSERVVAFYQGRVIADAAPGTAFADEDVQRHVTGTIAGGGSSLAAGAAAGAGTRSTPAEAPGRGAS